MDQKTVGILVFDDVEILDFCGPFEVFSVTRLNEARRLEECSPFRVLLVSHKMDHITTTGGMQVQPHCTLQGCPKLDVLLVPGGVGTRRELGDTGLLEWIRKQAGSTEFVTSVCTGSLVLGQAGLLDGRRATTHWAFLPMMRQLLPKVQVEEELHIVEDGNVITSAGVAAGIDLALLLVAKLYGEEVARNAARRMEYPYPESNQRRVAIAQ